MMTTASGAQAQQLFERARTLPAGQVPGFSQMSGPPVWPDDGVILYDGVCVFCSRWVRFVAKRDAAGRFRFTPIQSPYGRRLAEALGIDPDNPDTNALILGGRALMRSDATLAVISALPGWHWAGLLRLVPRFLRDPAYMLVARTRYRMFGRRDVCYRGEPWLAERVIMETAAIADR